MLRTVELAPVSEDRRGAPSEGSGRSLAIGAARGFRVSVGVGAVTVVLRQDLADVVQEHAEQIATRFALHLHAVFRGLADGAAGLDDVEHALDRAAEDE